MPVTCPVSLVIASPRTESSQQQASEQALGKPPCISPLPNQGIPSGGEGGGIASHHSGSHHSTPPRPATAARHGTAHGTAQHSTHHGTARHGTAQHSTAQHSTAQHTSLRYQNAKTAEFWHTSPFDTPHSAHFSHKEGFQPEEKSVMTWPAVVARRCRVPNVRTIGMAPWFPSNAGHTCVDGRPL